MADLIEMRGEEISTFEVVSMEDMNGNMIDVKVPRKETTLEWEQLVLDKLQADLASLQIQVDAQQTLVNSIQSLAK